MMKNKIIFLLLTSINSLIVSTVPYMSQFGQDKFVNEMFFKNKKNGVFVDIGAHDGKTLSNTYFFEKELGWTGICFEPIPSVFEKLKQNRSCICINACVGINSKVVPFYLVKGYPEMLSGMVESYHPEHLKRMKNEISLMGGSLETVDIQAVTLNQVCKQYNINHIDYLSLDIEGAELEILKSIDFNAIDISVIDVENNYRDPEFRIFMESNGFKLIPFSHNCSLPNCAQVHDCDEIYVNNNYKY